MAKKQTLASEVASALGAAAARVENLKPKRTATKHIKARTSQPEGGVTEVSAPSPENVTASPVENAPTTLVAVAYDREAISLLAYSYWEARGYQGGSQEEDWIRAEQAFLNR